METNVKTELLAILDKLPLSAKLKAQRRREIAAMTAAAASEYLYRWWEFEKNVRLGIRQIERERRRTRSRDQREHIDLMIAELKRDIGET